MDQTIEHTPLGFVTTQAVYPQFQYFDRTKIQISVMSPNPPEMKCVASLLY